MANRNSFSSLSGAAVAEVEIPELRIKTGAADGVTIYAHFGTSDGDVVLKHQFEDLAGPANPVTYQTIACVAGVLNVVVITHKFPDTRVFYVHDGAGTVNIETVTSLGQI